MHACFICSSKKIISLEGVEEYWHCLNCGVVWKKRLVKSFYKADYYKPASSIASILFSPILNFFYSLRINYSKKKNHNLWIDVGAGDGNFLSMVKSKRKIGVEDSAAARKIMLGKGIEVLSDEVFLKKRNLNADTISFWHVLEHLQNPKKFIEASARNLKKGGELIIGVPNIDSFEFNFFKKDWFHLETNLHLWYFSPKSIKILFEKCGFRLVEIDYFSLEHHFTGLLQSFINKGSSSRNSLHKLVKSIRQKNSPKLNVRDFLVNVFWLSLGIPLILIMWVINSLMGKSGSFVAVAVKKSP